VGLWLGWGKITHTNVWLGTYPLGGEKKKKHKKGIGYEKEVGVTGSEKCPL
jgi:hypothetical protein